jgi:hypothetical protein
MPHCQSYDCNHCNPAHKCTECGVEGRGPETKVFTPPGSDKGVRLCSDCLVGRLSDLFEFTQRLRNAHDGTSSEEESEVFEDIDQALARAKAEKP